MWFCVLKKQAVQALADAICLPGEAMSCSEQGELGSLDPIFCQAYIGTQIRMQSLWEKVPGEGQGCSKPTGRGRGQRG